MRELAADARVHDRVPRGREHDDAVVRREPRSLQVPEAVLGLQERPRVRPVDVGTPERVDLPVFQMHVHQGLAIGTDRRIGAVLDDALALAGAKIEPLDRVVVARERTALDDRGAPVEVEHVARRVEPRARVEDVVGFVLHHGSQAGAVDVHNVQVGAESAFGIGLRREREHDRLSTRMQ